MLPNRSDWLLPLDLRSPRNAQQELFALPGSARSSLLPMVSLRRASAFQIHRL